MTRARYSSNVRTRTERGRESRTRESRTTEVRTRTRSTRVRGGKSNDDKSSVGNTKGDTVDVSLWLIVLIGTVRY
jgi:hypothetical protein